MVDDRSVAEVALLDALGAVRSRLAKSERFRGWSPDAKLELYGWLHGIEGAVLGSGSRDAVAQSGDYLGLYRGLDMLGIDDEGILDRLAAEADLAWEAWYRGRSG